MTKPVLEISIKNWHCYFCFLTFIFFLIIFSASYTYADNNIGDYNGLTISNVTLKFPPNVKTEGILDLIKTKIGNPFNIMDADDSIRLIYSTGQCSDVQLFVEPHGKVIDIGYICKPVLNVSKVEFYGVKSVSIKELEHAIYLQSETHFYNELLDIVKDRVIRFYNDKGYMMVKTQVTFTQTSYNDVILFVKVDEGYPAQIKEIEINGEPKIKTALLLKEIGISPGDILTKDKLDAIVSKLELYYHSKGYWQVNIQKPEVIFSEDFRSAYIKLNIMAGPEYVIEFVGAKNISRDTLMNIIGIKKSEGFINFELFKNRIENALKDMGYYFCTVDYNIVKREKIHVIFNIHEWHKVYIAGIFFSGNTHIKSSLLRSQMLTSPWTLFGYIYNYKYNGILAPKRFENDLKAIIYLYKINGFLNVRITDVKINFIDERKEWINVIIYIKEGRQTIVNSISIKGVSEGMQNGVMGLIDEIQPGKPFDMWQAQEVKRKIEQLYFSNGYINAQINYDYTIHEDQADISFNITEGNRITIGKIIIAGNTKTADWVIKKNLDFKTGMYFIPDNVVQSRINLLRTGYFESVDIKPITNTKNKNVVDVAVIVRERKTSGIEFSIGYGTEEGYRGAVELYDNNIMGTARSINFHVGGGVQPVVYSLKQMFDHSNYITNQRDLELGYTENYIFNTDMTGRINLIDSYIRNLWIGYGLKTESGIMGLDKNIGSTLKLSLQYDFEIREPMDVQPGAILTPADFEQKQLGIVSPIIIFDDRNNPFNPTNGYLQVFRLDWAKHWFFSEEEYLKLYTAATKYWPITNGLTYVLSLRAGYAWPLGTTTNLPIEKRFFLGGGSTIRGFLEDTVGPMGPDNTPVGGDIMLNYQTELRVRLIDSFDGVVFTDGGNVWSSPAVFELKGMHDIRKTAGVGVRYVTPAGALNLDVGFKLDKRPGESLTEWHFYIGTIL
ncbi:MAG: outer membrane protein assembly factor BamA [bacterium]